MVTKFRTEKTKPIVFCILDIIEECQSNTAREVCINLTDFLIHQIDDYDYDIFISKDEDELLNEVAKYDYNHAVVIAAGTSLKMSTNLFSAIEDQCQEDFFIAGHILDRSNHFYYKNACFELHRQFYIIDLNQYKELGCPAIGKEEWVDYQQLAPLRSKESLFDDPEIASWIKKGTELKNYSVKLHGWNILNIGLNNDKKLLPLGHDIRNNKKYLYYEYDHVFLSELSNIKYYQLFATNFFAGWNSDELNEDIKFNGAVDQYVTVGIGFNWIKNLDIIGFTENTKVIFTDINYNCLMFMKNMVENWDGNNYEDFYWNNKPMLPNDSIYTLEGYKDQIQEKWQEFLSTVDNWKLLWEKVQQLTFDYILIDYTASFNLDWLTSNKNTLINFSNLFNHAPFVWQQSLKYRISCENSLIKKLKNKDPNVTILMTSRAADGFWKNKNQTYLGKASNFAYTNIEDLKMPDWHNKNWIHNSNRPLGTKINLEYITINDIDIGIYKDGPLGIGISGGADSAILLYILMSNTSSPIHIYHMWSNSRKMAFVKSVDAVIEMCSSLTGNTNYYVHKIQTEPQESIEFYFNMVSEELEKNRIDIMYMALTNFPPEEVYLKFNEQQQNWHNEFRSDKTIHPLFGLTIYENYSDTLTLDERTYIPLRNYNKKDIAKIYEVLNLTGNLLPVTRSCEDDDHRESHCGKCWWCQERIWAFGGLVE